MGIVEQDETGGEDGNRDGVSGFPHDGVDQRDSDGSHHGHKPSHRDVGNFGRAVLFPNRLKHEIAVESTHPPGESVEHLGQGRMHIKVVFTSNVLRRKSTEMHFIESGGELNRMDET